MVNSLRPNLEQFTFALKTKPYKRRWWYCKNKRAQRYNAMNSIQDTPVIFHIINPGCALKCNHFGTSPSIVEWNVVGDEHRNKNNTK